jgi:hypothetical protein
MMFTDWLELREFGFARHRALLAEAARARQGRQRRGKATTNGHDRDGSASAATPANAVQVRVAGVAPDDEEWCRRAGFTEAEYRRLAFLRWLYRRGWLIP